MAKIVYYPSPVSHDREEFIIEVDTLIELLREIGIHNSPSLAVRINGKSHNELSMLHPIKEEDFIEIKHMVHGSGDEGNKNALATVVQIAALVASFVIPGGQAIYAVAKAAILVAGAVIAGAIRRAGIQNTVADRDASTETAANAFSLSAAQNEIRALEPMSLIIGSHRISPDFASKPYSLYSGGGTPSVITRWSNGVIVLNDSFPNTIPAGWLSSNVFNQFTYDGDPPNPSSVNFWPYPLRVQEGWDATKFINDAKLNQSEINNPTYEDYMHFTTATDFTYHTPDGTIQGRGPVIIEHFDPNDPVVIRNGGQPYRSSLQMLCWSYFSQYKHSYTRQLANGGASFDSFSQVSHGNPANIWPVEYQEIYIYLIGLQAFINGQSLNVNPVGADNQISNIIGIPGSNPMQNLYKRKDQTNPNEDNWFFLQMTENTVFDMGSGSDNYNPNMDLVFDFFDDNGDELNSLDKRLIVLDFFNGINANSISVPGRYFRSSNVFEVPKNQEVRHLFHYGLGDLEVSDRRIGNTDLTRIQGQENTLPVKLSTAWIIPNFLYASNVKSAEGADLINNVEFSGPEALASLNPEVQANFVTRETPDNCSQIFINIEGRSFESNDDGTFSLLGADFEIQIRKTTDAVFSLYDGAFFLGSNKPEAIRQTIAIDLSLDPDKYIVRIRKRTPDPTVTELVQDFTIVNFYFFIVDETTYVAENREGLTLQATGSFNGTTQSYNSLVEASCWTYQNDSWVWQHTRNPAWWFLYYARGGFTNETANNNLTYPFSPTIGWVNSADHPDNIERMFGAGLRDEEIDIERIIEWADFCDTQDLKIDMVIREDNNTMEFLNRIADVGRASASYYRGKLSVVVEDPSQIPVAMYGMGNIIKDSFTVTYVTQDLPDVIIGNYSDRDEEWETRQVSADVPNTSETITRVEVALPGVTERAQAQREVNLLAARQLYQRRQYSWRTDAEGLLVRRGDLVYLSHDITQYDQSGRCVEFAVENNLVTRIKTGIQLEPLTHVMIRTPYGEIISYEAQDSGSDIILNEAMTLDKAPNTLSQSTREENFDSPWRNSFPEDFIFFAGPKETPGKIVRISEIHAEEDLTFTIDAIEEEAAMYSYEFTGVEASSQDLSQIVSRVVSADYKNLGNGKVEICWTLDAAYGVQIFNSNNPTIPVQIKGGSTIAGNSAILELEEGDSYSFVIEPLTLGTPFKKESFNLIVRL